MALARFRRHWDSLAPKFPSTVPMEKEIQRQGEPRSKSASFCR